MSESRAEQESESLPWVSDATCEAPDLLRSVADAMRRAYQAADPDPGREAIQARREVLYWERLAEAEAPEPPEPPARYDPSEYRPSPTEEEDALRRLVTVLHGPAAGPSIYDRFRHEHGGEGYERERWQAVNFLADWATPQFQSDRKGAILSELDGDRDAFEGCIRDAVPRAALIASRNPPSEALIKLLRAVEAEASNLALGPDARKRLRGDEADPPESLAAPSNEDKGSKASLHERIGDRRVRLHEALEAEESLRAEIERVTRMLEVGSPQQREVILADLDPRITLAEDFPGDALHLSEREEKLLRTRCPTWPAVADAVGVKTTGHVKRQYVRCEEKLEE